VAAKVKARRLSVIDMGGTHEGVDASPSIWPIGC